MALNNSSFGNNSLGMIDSNNGMNNGGVGGVAGFGGLTGSTAMMSGVGFGGSTVIANPGLLGGPPTVVNAGVGASSFGANTNQTIQSGNMTAIFGPAGQSTVVQDNTFSIGSVGIAGNKTIQNNDGFGGQTTVN